MAAAKPQPHILIVLGQLHRPRSLAAFTEAEKRAQKQSGSKYQEPETKGKCLAIGP